MRLAEFLYSKVTGKEAPYYLKNNSVLKLLLKPIRKYFTNVVAANCPFNCIRILIYRLCGFKIGKGTFIGMRSNIISKGAGIDGITIGRNAVIGAATLVNKSIPEGATAVGVPCRVIKEKPSNE